MLTRKNILTFLFIAVVVFFMANQSVKALTFNMPIPDENADLSDENSNFSQSMVVADISLSDAKITKQEGNKINLSFDIISGKYVQPDIGYSVELVKQQGENQIKVDEKIYSERIIIYENQTIKKEIEYLAPGYLSGDFELWIFSKNSEGMLLGLTNVGQISLIGNDQYVEIIPESCYLRVEGEDESIHYLMNQGVAVTLEEKIVVDCEFWNHFNESQTFTLQTETYQRALSGKKVETKPVANTNLSLEAQEKKRFQFALAKSQDPQSYSVRLKLVNATNQTISNEVEAHYVVQGIGATIQNVNLDKSYYKKGEMAKLALFITGPADMFPGSRLDATDVFAMPAYISIKGSDGAVCSEFSSALESNNIKADYEILMLEECFDPEIAITVKDNEGNILAQKTHKLISQIESSAKPIKVENEKIKQSPLVLLLGIGLAAIVSLISLFILIRNSRKNK